jgi:hypothetical protein
VALCGEQVQFAYSPPRPVTQLLPDTRRQAAVLCPVLLVSRCPVYAEERHNQFGRSPVQGERLLWRKACDDGASDVIGAEYRHNITWRKTVRVTRIVVQVGIEQRPAGCGSHGVQQDHQRGGQSG